MMKDPDRNFRPILKVTADMRRTRDTAYNAMMSALLDNLDETVKLQAEQDFNNASAAYDLMVIAEAAIYHNRTAAEIAAIMKRRGV